MSSLRPVTPLPARITIADVAREAGVSKATVSRFLNHRDTLLTRDIAARVESAIEALGYSPSPMAQALKRGQSRLIGLVVADVTNPFSVAVLRGAEQACQEAGYLVMLFNLGNASQRESQAIAALANYQVDGFILNTLGREPAAALDAARRGKPVVLVDRRHHEMRADFVSLDNASAMDLAVRHLMDNGWRDLLFVSEPAGGVSSRLERADAFRTLVARHGELLHGRTLELGDEPIERALQRLRDEAQGRPIGVISSNAVVTLRVAEAVAALGWQFGRELGFVGFDETEWAALVGPGLSTIAQPTAQLGRLAANCLLERVQGQEPPHRTILVPGQLVVRGSSAPAGQDV